MVCPFCLHSTTKVYNSRQNKRTARVWRRRRCDNCHESFTTYEKLDLGILEVIKPQNTPQPYKRSLLFASLQQVCDGFDSPTETVDALIDTVEIELLKLKRTQISNTDIAEVVLTILERFNTAAFMRYLSYHPAMIEKRGFKR